MPYAAKNPWAYNFTVDGYISLDSQFYVDPVFVSLKDMWRYLAVLTLRPPHADLEPTSFC